jgi:hypothetical protein
MNAATARNLTKILHPPTERASLHEAEVFSGQVEHVPVRGGSRSVGPQPTDLRFRDASVSDHVLADKALGSSDASRSRRCSTAAPFDRSASCLARATTSPDGSAEPRRSLRRTRRAEPDNRRLARPITSRRPSTSLSVSQPALQSFNQPTPILSISRHFRPWRRERNRAGLDGRHHVAAGAHARPRRCQGLALTDV